MRALPPLLAIATACVNAGACVPETSVGSAIELRDSSGVVIVEHGPSALTSVPRWTLSDTPIVEIGGSAGDPNDELYRVQAVKQSNTGDILVLNSGTSEIRKYDRAGRHLLNMGRRGSGPGEFAAPLWLVVDRTDSILVYDFRLQRFSLFDTDGTPGREVLVQDQDIGLRQTAGLLRDGSLLIPHAPGPQTTVNGLRRDTVVLRRISTTGEELPPLGTFPGREYFGLVEGLGTGVTQYRAFGRSLEIALADSVLYVGPTDNSEIRMYTHAGVLRGIIRVATPPVRVTDDMKAAHTRTALAFFQDSALRARFGRLEEIMSFPPTIPAFSRLATDTDQNLWVRGYPVHPDSNTDWHVFDPAGRLSAVIRLPVGFVEHVFDRDRVIGTWTGEDDVERVRVYELRRTPS